MSSNFRECKSAFLRSSVWCVLTAVWEGEQDGRREGNDGEKEGKQEGKEGRRKRVKEGSDGGKEKR